MFPGMDIARDGNTGFAPDGWVKDERNALVLKQIRKSREEHETIAKKMAGGGNDS